MARVVDGPARMRARWIVPSIFLLGCMSTRQLSGPIDGRLQTGDHSHGFALKTTDVWRARLDPNSDLRVGTGDGAWSDVYKASALHADARGLWVDDDARIAHFADRVQLTGAPETLREPIERTRPPDGVFTDEGETWVLAAPPAVMRQWLIVLRRSIRPKGPPFGDIVTCDGDDCAVYRGTAADDYRRSFAPYMAPVRWIRFHTPEQGWHSAIGGLRLGEALQHTVPNRVGWRWSDIAKVEVKSFSGSKTLAAVIGTSAAAIVLAPAAILLRTVPGRWGDGGGGGGSAGSGIANAGKLLPSGGGDETAPPGDWEPTLATTESVRAPSLFSTGAQVRSWIRPTLSLDGGAAIRGDVMGTGLLARVRLGNVFEIGGGAREVLAKRATGWERSTTPVFQVGLHLPIDANERVAVPLGFEVSGSDSIAHDIRIPWGIRLQSKDAREFVTLSPATPQWVRLTGEHAGRWSLNAGAELGVAF